MIGVIQQHILFPDGVKMPVLLIQPGMRTGGSGLNSRNLGPTLGRT